MPKTAEQIRDLFHYHPPTAEGAQVHQALSRHYTALAEQIEQMLPEGREKALAYTKLEESKFWASAAVARNPATR